jgi:hypothetical protein
MIRYLRHLTLASLFAFGLTTASADQTNRVQNFDVQLYGLKQGRTSTTGNITTVRAEPVTIGTDKIIASLGQASGITFSKAARLVLVTPLEGTYSRVVIRDGTSSWDVTEFFAFEGTGGDVTASMTNARTKATSSEDYHILSLNIRDSSSLRSPLHFDVRGIAVTSSQSAPNGVPTTETTLEASGTGDQSGQFLILQGVIRIHGHRLEVVPSDGSTS